MNEAAPRVTAEDVRNVMPAVDAVLFALSHIPAIKPYAIAVRSITGVGQLFVPNYAEDLLAELKRTYGALVAAEALEDDSEVRKQNIRLRVCIELLTKNVP
jgi:hypothetical protein